ncbi:LysM peptidoglycan-binding domain-containing protein [Georgenia yuyongxinii]|uniref:LysM peptidoglycan-binding domain-containing protein n=1 Tax=Georgenia yuyongxinii TaxID=2589797 RepID=A0A5B8CBH8_9MICO|nr:LysM peptidoglycan-binding domain-containing protein [Georgenia yuyongxinii]QDC25526.1 LysM peptidoglycan-binding domain-containing protein [Georgenia yuyongxinii]
MGRSRDASRAAAGLAVTATAGLLGVALSRQAWSATTSLIAVHRSPAGLTATDLADVVLLAVVAVGACVAAWFALTAAGAVVVALLPRTGSVLDLALRRYGAPVLRRVLLTTAVTGLGVASSFGPALATTADQATVPADLGWGAPLTPVMDGVPPAPSTPEPAPPSTAPAPVAPPAAARDAHVVRAGDSLWSITASHLPDGATAAEIAVAWPRWYEANREVVGSDPDLIRPGQQLRAPIEETS